MSWHVDISDWLDKPRVIQAFSDDGQECDYLPERTCRWNAVDVLALPDDTNVTAYETECGARHTWWPDGLPKYCPSCGARVVEHD